MNFNLKLAIEKILREQPSCSCRRTLSCQPSGPWTDYVDFSGSRVYVTAKPHAPCHGLGTLPTILDAREAEALRGWLQSVLKGLWLVKICGSAGEHMRFELHVSGEEAERVVDQFAKENWAFHFEGAPPADRLTLRAEFYFGAREHQTGYSFDVQHVELATY